MKFSAFFRSILLCVCCLLPGISIAQQQTILVFGDSLSAAYGIPLDAGWVSLLQQELQSTHPQYQIVNASISGETTGGGLRRLTKALRQHQPGIVILELGANDGLRGIATQDIEANLRELIKQSHTVGAKVLMLGIRLPPNYGGGYTARFKALYPRLAKKYQVALVPFMLEGILPEEFQADNLHPAAAGQTKILHTVLESLQPLLLSSP